MNKHSCLYTIDNGNSHPHVARFSNNKLQELIPLESFKANSNSLNTFYIMSSVGKQYHLSNEYNKISIPKLDNKLFLDMEVDYSNTLGEDRLHQAYYLFKTQLLQKSCKSILLIDSGTFLTFDFINKEGLKGGYIFPGTQTFLDNYKRGENLPGLRYQETLKSDLGHSTQETILNASFIFHRSILREIIKELLPEKIIVTGGSSSYHAVILKDYLKESNVEESPNLIHYSLKFLAERLK